MPEGISAPRNHRIAVLIDGDNAQAALIDKILMEASKYGTLIVRRIYGDWTTTALKGWKEVLPSHAIQPIQQFQNTTGKNSTDSALIIDAMDLLYQGVVDCFCLVSSDSDFTRLATRIRESGSFVIGIGKQTTPQPFIAACDVFTKTELLNEDYTADKPVKPPEVAAPIAAKPAKPSGVAAPTVKKTANAPAIAVPTAKKQATTSSASAPAAKKPVNSPKAAAPKATIPSEVVKAKPDPLPLLKRAFGIKVQEDGWATLSSLGQALRQIDPSFDPRTYGHDQLAKLLRAYPDLFQIDDTVTNVRLKNSGSKRA